MQPSPSWETASCAATKELAAFYGTRRFITVFTGPYPEVDPSSPRHPTGTLMREPLGTSGLKEGAAGAVEE
jgi:hypothetical protein